MKRTIAVLGLLTLAALLAPGVAGADVIAGQGDATPVSDGPATNAFNLYVAGLGALTPLVVYVLNHFAPWVSEQVKGIVHAVLAAGVGVLVHAATGSDLGLNEQTLLAAGTAMVAALVGHFGWKVASINTALGGGSNRQSQPAGEKGQGDPLYLLVVVIVIIILVFLLLRVVN